jgi:hypothetical protein
LEIAQADERADRKAYRPAPAAPQGEADNGDAGYGAGP